MADTKIKQRGKFRRWKRAAIDWLYNIMGARMLGGTFHLLAHTLKLKYDGYEHYEAALRSGRPVIFAFWHEDLLSIFLGHLRHRLGTIGVMLSSSRDGEKMAKIIERYDLVPIRASSSRGAVRGMLELYRWLKRTYKGQPTLGTIAIDGPRGPRRHAKAGLAMLARKTGALVLPVAFNHSRKITFHSWDRMLLPKPFATTFAYFGEPMDPANWGDEDEVNAGLVTAELNRLKAKAGVE